MSAKHINESNTIINVTHLILKIVHTRKNFFKIMNINITQNK